MPEDRDEQVAAARSRAHGLVQRAKDAYNGTQVELARTAGLDAGVFNKYLHNRRRPDVRALRSLADALNSTVGAEGLVGEIYAFVEEAERSGVLRQRQTKPRSEQPGKTAGKETKSGVAPADPVTADLQPPTRSPVVVSPTEAEPAHREAMEHVRRGYLHLNRKEWKEAIDAFGDAEAAYPPLEDVIFPAYLGAHLSAGDHQHVLEKAEEVLTRTVEPDAAMLEVLYFGGLAASATGHAEIAIEWLMRVVTVCPGYRGAYHRWWALAGKRATVLRESEADHEARHIGSPTSSPPAVPAISATDRGEDSDAGGDPHAELSRMLDEASAAGWRFTPPSWSAALGAISRGDRTNWKELLVLERQPSVAPALAPDGVDEPTLERLPDLGERG